MLFCFLNKEELMTAYVIVDIHVNDPVGYEEYKELELHP